MIFMRVLIGIALVVLLWLGSASLVLAATLTLQTIGTSTVGGQSVSTWTYLGTNPVLTGKASPGSSVTITISATPATTTADATGNWTFTPTTLGTAGSYPISISSGSETISMTLTISPSTTATATSSATTTTAATPTPTPVASMTSTKGGVASQSAVLPTAGGVEDTIWLLTTGISLVGIALLSLSLTQQRRLARLHQQEAETFQNE